MNTTVRKYRAKDLISDAIDRDSQDFSTANEWVCGGVEMNCALFPPEKLALTWINAHSAVQQAQQMMAQKKI